VVPLTVKRGTVETWLIENARVSMPQPMHIRGFRFRILERRGSPANRCASLSPSRSLTRATRTMVSTDSLEHAELGMDYLLPREGLECPSKSSRRDPSRQ
jgi:FtsP/CotA-like multicopper oxidase with cupredoxin domain